MEINRLFYYIFLNCVLVQYLNAKTISLNELIAAEERQKKTALGENPQRGADRLAKPNSKEETISTETHLHNSPFKLPKNTLKDRIAKPTSIEITSTEADSRETLFKLPTIKLRGLFDRLPLLKHLASNAKIKRLRQDRETLTHTLFGDKRISPLKFRKEFQIRSPLKPKKIKLAPTSRQKRKNQSIKREISGNDHLKRKDIPLVKSLNMLFDDIIEPDEVNINGIKIKKHKRYRFDSDELFDNHSRKSSSRSRKKAVTASPSFSTEASSDTANITPSEDYDNSIDRPNTSIPILLSRNTVGSRRDNNGSSTRSRSAYNRNVKGNITRDHGTHEYNPGNRKNETYAESNEDDTHSNTRNDTSSVEYTRGRDRHESRNSKDRKTFILNGSKEENTADLPRKDKFTTGGIKIESKDFIREPVRRFRGYISKSKSTHAENLTESIQYEKVHEESILCATGNSTCDKQITNESGSFTVENEKVRSRNETMILIESNYPKTEKYFEGGSKKTPVVLIFDGYSVMRDKNGENELSGKTEIHIRS